MELGALTISIWLTALQVDFSSAHLASDTLLQIQGKFVDEPYMIIVADAADIVCARKFMWSNFAPHGKQLFTTRQAILHHMTSMFAPHNKQLT